MRKFNEEIDQLFADFGFGGRPATFFDKPPIRRFFAEVPSFDWTPKVEVREREGELCVRADLPGVKKDDITVEILENTLTIRGEHREEKEEKKEGFYKTERSYGSFLRTIPLPAGADIKHAKAQLEDGVLEITLKVPKLEEPKPRKLEISTAK
jgi:HSP20 family protein